MNLEKVLKAIVLILVILLASSLINQSIPKKMTSYWGLNDVEEQIEEVAITFYGESKDEDKVLKLTEEEEIAEFYEILKETKLKRLWFGGKDEEKEATCQIRVFAEGGEDTDFWLEMVDEKVYFMYMATYEWYVEDDSPLMEYIEKNK